MTSAQFGLIVVCTTVGALVGLSLTGSAAIGSGLGAFVGIAAGRMLRRREPHTH